MHIKLQLYFLVIIKLTLSLSDSEESILQSDTCFLLSSKTSKIQFKPIILNTESSNYLIPLILQKNSTGEVGLISISHLFDENKFLWNNLSVIRGIEEITIGYSSNVTLSKIVIPANQTHDLHLFIELDLINKHLSGITYSGDNQKIDEVNISINVPYSINNTLSTIYVLLGSFNASEGSFIGEVDFKYLQVGGNKHLLPNDKIFSGDIAIEEKCTQLDEIKKKKGTLGICTYSDKKKCLNGGECKVNGNGEPYCLCSKGDYTGRYCQFSLLPKSCSSIPSSGIHKIDVDGSDIGEMGYVKCDNGKTIISHNFPPNMVVRDKNIIQNLSYDINYKLMSTIQIRNLIQRSQKCQQFLSYSCYGNAPLNFREGHTSFESIYYGGLKPYHQLSDGPEYQCNCKKNNKCYKENVNCNCDIDSGNNTQYDTGTFSTKQNVGIKRINIYSLESQIVAKRGLGLLNISELSCYGDIGYDNDFSLSFKSNDGVLVFYRPVGRRVEVEFRLPSNGENFDILQINDKETFVHMFVTNDNEFVFSLRRKANIICEGILTFSGVIGDGIWHHVILELNRHEFRVSIDKVYLIIDDQNVIATLEELLGKNLEFRLQNFVGCFRSFYIDDDLINLSHELSLSKNEHIFSGCRVMCQKDTCQHESKCVENIKEGTYKCICKNDNIYYGDHCQFSINKDTDISFHNPYESYIGYDSRKSLKNMTSIYQDLTMSFKTDQTKALLVFAIDEFNNFFQIHLTDEFRIILSMNQGNVSKQCTVHSGKGTYFNNMEWRQIQLKYFTNNVTLFVDEQFCTIVGSVSQTKSYVVLDGADDEIVIPPILPAQTNILPYKVLYVGGVPRAKESGELITWSTIYNTKLPSILGCLRGLKFSHKFLDLRGSDLVSSNDDSISMRCHDESCKYLNCQNKGHCSVKWFQSPPHDTFCDCSMTSFYGPTCEKDDTIKFTTPNQQLSFDMSKIRQRYDLFDSKIQTFKFAFSADKEVSDVSKQMLSFVEMDNSKENIEITLDSDYELSVNLKDEKILFKGTFMDGYRHFIQIILDQRKHKIWVVVDDEKKILNFTKLPYNLARTKQFVFGASDVSEGNNGYGGFISNVDVNYHRSDRVHFMPLKYYKDSSHEYYECIKVKPKLEPSLLVNHISSFKPNDNEVKETVESLDFPPWDVPLIANVIKEPLSGSVPPNTNDNEEGFNYIILMIALIVLILILILFIIIGMCLSSKLDHRKRSVPILRNLGDPSKKNTYVPIGEQLTPLNTTGISYYPGKDDLTLPEPLLDTEPAEMIPPLKKLGSLSSDLEDEKHGSEGNSDDDPLIQLTDYEEGRNSMIYM